MSETPLNEFYDMVRAVLGDHEGTMYPDKAISRVLQAVVKMGGLNAKRTYTLREDAKAIVPELSSPYDYALLSYRAALMFVRPESAPYGFKTRAFSETRGEQREFLRALEREIGEAESEGAGVFHTWQSFGSWVDAATGLDIGARLTRLKVTAPERTIVLAADGWRVDNQ